MTYDEARNILMNEAEWYTKFWWYFFNSPRFKLEKALCEEAEEVVVGTQRIIEEMMERALPQEEEE